MLPSGISIKQGQNLIIGPYRNPKFLEYYEKIITKNPPPSSEILNVFCFLSAKYRQDPYTYTGLFFLGVAIYILFNAIGLGESPFFCSLIGIGFIYYLYKPFLFYSLLTSLSPQDPDIYSYGIFGYRHDTSCTDIYGFKGFRIAILNPNSDFRTYFLGHAFVLEYFH